MNSFAGIEWLPSPGLTPESWRYRTDSWQESVLLWRAKSPLDEVTISERIAREKLAELEAMIRAGNLAAAEISIDHYRHYIQHAEAALAKVAPQASADVTLKFATALLEHQFIITSDYLDLPRDSRRVAAGMIETAAKAYANLRAQLPRRIQESLFFKEEEVRWSRQQAEGADAQGL
ncbi:MAG: hypothetical protein EXR86_13005 [Gammaproteobacteria bacterium]|nr:hypothetical protein [Gammaproteobacteria bacterium]